MALANTAVLLARGGSRVLIVDWDLEAPGLHKYFEKFSPRTSEEIAAKSGIVDLLFGLQNEQVVSWRDAIINIEIASNSSAFKLDFISAGRSSPDYSQRLQNLDWRLLYERADLGTFLNDMRSDWKFTYDYVLLDSRTGVTDIGDICSVILPDVLVVLFVTNEQNLEGIEYVIRRAQQVTQRLPTDRPKLVTVPVLARDEVYTEYRRSEEWRNKADKRLNKVLIDWLPASFAPGTYFQKMFIPYVAHWSFGETLPVIENEQELNKPASISSAYARLASLIKADLDWSALASGDNPLQLDILKAEKRSLEANIGSARRTARAVVIGSIVAAAIAVVSAIGYGFYSQLEEAALERAVRADRSMQEAEMARAQADMARAQAAMAQAEAAEAQRKAEEAEQQRLALAKAEEERRVQALAEAEAKLKTAEAEQQRLRDEIQRQAKAAADTIAAPDADAKLQAAVAEQWRLKDELQRQAKAAADADAKRRAAEAEQQRLASDSAAKIGAERARLEKLIKETTDAKEAAERSLASVRQQNDELLRLLRQSEGTQKEILQELRGGRTRQ
jgi:hypothetical protein